MRWLLVGLALLGSGCVSIPTWKVADATRYKQDRYECTQEARGEGGGGFGLAGAFMILSVRKSDVNDKGEILDPWGTPLNFYFSYNEVMIRSAGPNKVWEDSAIATADDQYRTAPIDHTR